MRTLSIEFLLTRHASGLVSICAALFAIGAVCEARADSTWAVRVAATSTAPDVDFVSVDEDGILSVDGDSGEGIDVRAERRFSDRLGLDFGFGFAEPGLDVTVTPSTGPMIRAASDVEVMTASVGLGIHLTPSKFVDVTVSPLASFVDYGDVELVFEQSGMPETVRLRGEDDVALGAAVGVDVGTGKWFFHGSAAYLATEIELIDDEGLSTSFDFDPLTIRLGFGVRF